MFLRVIISIAFVGVAPAAFAEKIYVVCEPRVSSVEDIPLSDFYALPPVEGRKQFRADLLAGGIIGYMEFPPTTWLIDSESKEITSPERFVSPLEISVFSDKSILAYDQNSAFHLNRVDGRLLYTRSLNDAQRNRWLEKHGKELPTPVDWLFKCRSSSRPAV